MLKLREIREQVLDYLPIIHKWHSDPKISTKLGFIRPQSIEDTKNLLSIWQKDPKRKIYLIKHNEAIIGYVMLSEINLEHSYCELHTVVGEIEYIGKSICVDIIDGILDITFNGLKMHRVTTYVLGNNPKLRNTAIKYGWKEEGIIRDFLLCESGERVNYHIFGILKTEFKRGGIKCQ